MIINEYAGVSLKVSKSIPRIKQDNECLSAPELFWKTYIQPRQPCLIDSIQKSYHVDRNILEQLAGGQIVQVEKRLRVQERFGQARSRERQIEMTLSQFLAQICDHSSYSSHSSHSSDTNIHPGEYLYLSTQEDSDDRCLKDPLITTPCRQLIHHEEIPGHINLAGKLRLHSCNLWLGRSRSGSSSGLHHDFHDNFYILLQGRKRFTLFSPDYAAQLQTYGNIHTVCKTGVISYVDQSPVHHMNNRRKRKWDQTMDQRKCTNNQESICSVDFVDLSSKEEYEELESSCLNSDDDPLKSNSDDCNYDEEEIVLGKGFDYVSSDESHHGKVDLESSDIDDYDRLEGNEPNDEESFPPQNFSRINLLHTESELKHEFPDFYDIPSCTVEITAGQMLYLPAGWFHEVRSFTDQNQGLNLDDCHVALNYWYHPPSNLKDV